MVSGVTSEPAVKTAESAQGSSQAERAMNGMGSDDFLTLLVAQLNNQNPLDPMDNAQFIMQLTQFSSLEQLISIRDAVESGTDILANLNQSPEQQDEN